MEVLVKIFEYRVHAEREYRHGILEDPLGDELWPSRDKRRVQLILDLSQVSARWRQAVDALLDRVTRLTIGRGSTHLVVRRCQALLPHLRKVRCLHIFTSDERKFHFSPGHHMGSVVSNHYRTHFCAADFFAQRGHPDYTTHPLYQPMGVRASNPASAQGDVPTI